MNASVCINIFYYEVTAASYQMERCVIVYRKDDYSMLNVNLLNICRLVFINKSTSDTTQMMLLLLLNQKQSKL